MQNVEDSSENTWISPKGGIWMSVILGAPSGFENIISDCSCSITCKMQYIRNTWCRYVIEIGNDLLMNDKKVAGIITDAVLDSKGLHN